MRDFCRTPVHPSAGIIQTKSADAREARPAAPPIAYDVARAPGRPLDPAARTFMEARLRHDFSSVRVHAGTQAAYAARAVDARAYTLGQNIVFGQGEYTPGTTEGTRLLAHELTHVVQQRQGISLKGGIGQIGDAYERHADAVADAVVADRPAATLLANRPRGGSGAGGAAIQRQQAPAAASVPATEQAVETEGDKMRRAILEAAEGRYGDKTTIVSEAEIKDIQEGRWRMRPVKLDDGTEIEMSVQTATPVKNFTTCIEFAGQTFSDASKIRSKALGRDAKESLRMTRLLSGILAIYNKEFGIQAQIDAFNKAIQMFVKPTNEQNARIAKFEQKKIELADSKTGEKFHDKGVDQQIKGQDLAIKQIGAAIAAMKREKDKLQAKIDKLKIDQAALDAQDDALVRPATPMTGRPRPGEYILLGAGSAQPYGVSTATQVTLAKGAFKHIAVFKSSEPAPGPKDKPGEKWEKWHTIDGGGSTARTTELFVCISDLRVQFGNPENPWSSSKTSLIGWIDIDKLVAGGAAP
ncbi:DUF4157 domain-containing protein [Sphingomonas sp. DG1-23]|nr:DUF4157 domain-containing protein [Sphingomonas sp. DG1-23]MDP5279077.1 DUF4157 domain-containing protein [Sphingomonas sp. DG1-23]